LTTSLLQDWLTHYDPIHRGWTRTGIANGLCATGGYAFPRIRGGYNLYRTLVGSDSGPVVVVGAAGADASRVRPFGWVTHAPTSAYVYRLVPVSGGGIENRVDVTATTVRFNPGGLWIGPLPNAPADLRLIPLSQGRFSVCWSYSPHEQEIEPAGFFLYSNGTDASAIDYSVTEADVRYRPGQQYYEMVSQPQPHGARVGWAVRAYAPNRQEEQNVNCVFAPARSQGPPGDPVVHVSLVAATV